MNPDIKQSTGPTVKSDHLRRPHSRTLGKSQHNIHAAHRQKTTALTFPVLTRPSAHFWTYDPPENWEEIFHVQDRDLLPQFRTP